MDRLKKRREFVATSQGKRWAQPGLVLQARRRDANGEAPRVGFTVTRKVGSSVTRNRARRRLRSVAESILPLCGKPGYDYVLVGRVGTLTRTYAELVDDLKVALRRVHSEQAKNMKSRTHG